MTDPVLIVGAGPTGLTAALELSRMAVSVRLVDKRQAPATTSRAIGVQARTLELFEQRGLAEEMIRLGNKGRFASIYGGGKRVFRLDFGHVESRYPFMLLISQAETERILREAVARQGVTPQWNTELVGIGQDALSQDASPVQGILKLADGSLERVTAPWLISAEGAHSLVRSTLDLPFEGHTREEQYVLGDLLVAGDLPDSDICIFSSDHGFMGLFPMGGEHFRLIASNPLSKPSKNAEPSLDELQRIYDQRSHIPARFHDLRWSSWFRINSRMVSQLKVGRLLLGGDAAHIHSPAGAQGMNTGIQDMINVSWKLAMVINGQAPPSILDTYEADRLSVMRGVLFRTDTLTNVIGTENLIVRTLINHLGPFIGGAELVQENATAGMSQVALNYRNGSLSEDHSHGGALRAGDRVPDMPVRLRSDGNWEETTLLSALDASHLTLVAAVPDGTTLPSSLKACVPESRFVEIAADAKDAARFQTTFGKTGAAVLVRPDGYAGLTSPISLAADHLAAYRRKWFSASAAGARSQGAPYARPRHRPDPLRRPSAPDRSAEHCAASVLARCARLLGLPVHHSVVPEGGKAPEVLPDLAKGTEGAPQFARMTADPFLDPQTREAIDAVKRPVLVIAGLATEAVVLRAALSALESDYRVQVPVDACGGLSARTEDAALRQIEAAGGVTTSVVSLMTAMAPDFAREPGRNTFAALQALRLASAPQANEVQNGHFCD